MCRGRGEKIYIYKCTTQKSRPKLKGDSFWRVVPQDWTVSLQGISHFGGEMAASSARLSCIAGIKHKRSRCGVLEELLFLSWTSAWSVNTSYQPVGRLSSQSPSLFARFDSAVGVFFFCLFLFFSSRVASCRKSGLPCGSFFFFFFKDIITNAHQLTGTRLDLFINSLWFNSLTLLPCYANSCGQSMTPSRWGFGQIIFCLTTPLTDVEWRFAFKRASFLAFVFCFCFFRWVYSSIETGIKRTCQL